jgi:hypothetical protein
LRQAALCSKMSKNHVHKKPGSQKTRLTKNQAHKKTYRGSPCLLDQPQTGRAPLFPSGKARRT